MSDRKQGKGRKRKAPPTKAEVKAVITAAFKEAGKRKDTPTARRIAAAKRHNVEMDSRPQSGMLTVATNAPAKPMSDERLFWNADRGDDGTGILTRGHEVLASNMDFEMAEDIATTHNAEIDRLRADLAYIRKLQITFRDGKCPNCGFAAEDCANWKDTATEMERMRAEVAAKDAEIARLGMPTEYSTNDLTNTTHVQKDDGGPAVKLYVASRASVPERPAMWRKLRGEGWSIVSSWIDEAGDGETEDFEKLWKRIESEIRRADGLILYAEQTDFPLKGALIEAGIALGLNKPVAIVCGGGLKLEDRSKRPIGSWVSHPNCKVFELIVAARDWIKAIKASGGIAEESPFKLAPLDRETGESVLRICEPNRAETEPTWQEKVLRAYKRIDEAERTEEVFGAENFIRLEMVKHGRDLIQSHASLLMACGMALDRLRRLGSDSSFMEFISDAMLAARKAVGQ